MRPSLELCYCTCRVGVGECSLNLSFYLLWTARPFGFLMGEGLFFPIDETRHCLKTFFAQALLCHIFLQDQSRCAR